VTADCAVLYEVYTCAQKAQHAWCIIRNHRRWLLYVTRWVGQRRFLSAGLLGFDGSLLGCL